MGSINTVMNNPIFFVLFDHANKKYVCTYILEVEKLRS